MQNDAQKIIDFITDLKRGTITISISKKINFKDFETEIFKILPNSSVEIHKKEKNSEIRKRVAFAKFVEIFKDTLTKYENEQNYFMKINHSIAESKTIYVIQFLNGEYFDLPLKDDLEGVTNTVTGLFKPYGIKPMSTKNVLETPEFKIFLLSIFATYALMACYLFVAQIFLLLIFSFILSLLALICLISILYKGFIRKEFSFFD